MRKFLDRVHVCAKFHENRKGSGFFFVDLVWNDPLSQFLKSHISGTLETISLKFGMLSTEVGGSVHSKNCLQGITELRRCKNCVFVLPVNILTGVACQLLGSHDTLLCVLIYIVESQLSRSHLSGFSVNRTTEMTALLE